MQEIRIAFLGLGLMGGPMARNLLAAGYPVIAWNRTAAKAEALADHGALVAGSAADAVRLADVVISMLSDGQATAAVLADPALLDELRPGMTWIEMASVQPGEARAQADLLGARGVAHLDAPVSGGTAGAAAASLAIMVGGTAEDASAMERILTAMGRPLHVGPSGSGQLAKLANQAIVGVTIAAVAEAMLLVKRGGADPAAVRAALKGGFADSTILQLHGTRMTSGDFTPGGAARNQLKDLDNALAEAAALGLTLPETEAVRARFAQFCGAMGGGDKDHAGLYLELLARNGLKAEGP